MVHLFVVLYEIGAGPKEITKQHGLMHNVERLNTNGNRQWKGGKILKWTGVNWKICWRLRENINLYVKGRNDNILIVCLNI